ncbi:S66 peptidase family protein [Brevibacillus sp. SYSU BS000544]|uniref:S66 peptidase family protein n=1 Tax=Brevibacillus sp. SYSU BS000544 TaxID=3416443 RepID=UPI003CE53BA8
MNKGKLLKKGDTIGVVATSSPCNEEKLAKVNELVQLGFHVKIAETCYQNYGGYLAGTPEARASEVNAMFADPEVDAIMCMRGGYGSPQILPLLDYELIRENPKLFIGYSDITALHSALGQKANLATVHAFMASVGIMSEVDEFSRDSLLRAITTPEPLGFIQNPEGEEMQCLVGGHATGPIVGGNLSLVSALMGTPYELDTRGKILFLEDIGEEPYRVDRMLTQLALAGKFADAAGILIGTWTNCEPVKYENSFEILDVVQNIIVPYNKPTIWNLQAGHGSVNIALPFGVRSTMNASDCTLFIEESVVDE